MKFGETTAEISNFGRVKSCNGVTSFGTKRKDGYFVVTINYKSYMVHQVVALAFIGSQPSNDHNVDHIDKHPNNNKFENLRWVTQQEQIEHSMAKSVDVYKNNIFVCSYKSMKLTEKALGICPRTISTYIAKKTKTRQGYTFKLSA
jgi:hypothetical protein